MLHSWIGRLVAEVLLGRVTGLFAEKDRIQIPFRMRLPRLCRLDSGRRAAGGSMAATKGIVSDWVSERAVVDLGCFGYQETRALCPRKAELWR